MAYEKRELINEETLIDKDLMDHMQDGIFAAHEEVGGIKELYIAGEIEPPDIVWVQGRYDAASTTTANSTTRIRTEGFFGIFNGVLSCASADYMFLVHAYDENENFVGSWNGGTQTFGGSSYWLSEFDCNINPNYKYKMTVRKGTAGSENITPADGVNIVFDFASGLIPNANLLHDSKNIGFAWEANGINLDTGADQTINSRVRSQYVPVEEGKTYAFNVAEADNAYAEYVFYYTADKTPILIDTTNNRYYTRLSSGFFPKALTIPTGYGIAYIRLMVTSTNFDYHHGQVEEGAMATSYRSATQREIDNTGLPNNVSGFMGKRILLLGDSITAQNNWSKWFEASVKPETLYNYAVGGASWCDETSGIVYDGTATPNVIGNQVQKAINNNLTNMDCIIVFAGTNDTNVDFPSDEDVESAFFDGSMNPVALADVDRTTWQGAMRWSLETLILRYPTAKIFVCSPVQRMYKADEPVRSLYGTIKGKGETIHKMAKRMGVEFIDTAECGISACRSLDFADGLHPWQRTSEKIARYIIARYMAHFCQN